MINSFNATQGSPHRRENSELTQGTDTTAWTTHNLNEIYEFASGLSKSRSEFGFGFPFLSFMEVFNNYFLPKELNQLANTTDAERSRCSIKRGDVFLTRTSETQEDLGMSCVALKDYPGATFNGFTKRLRPNRNIEVAPEYAGFYFRSPRFRAEVTSMSSVTTRASLNNDMLAALKMVVPPLPEQRAIAGVLSSLDDKIDLLQRQNKTLKAIAETLFRQWFVEEARDDWEEVTIDSVCQLNQTTLNKSYPLAAIEYLDTGSLTDGVFGATEHFNLADAPSRAKRLVQHNDILISTVRPNQRHFGIVKDPLDNLVVSTGFCILTATEIDTHFVYLLLTTNEMTEFLHSVAEGSTSTYPSLKPSDIGCLTFRMPPDDRLAQFAELAQACWSKIATNYTKTRTLEKLRDTLLPKLMSGEVRVQYD